MEEDQKGLPDGMSCAGIFGSNSTKTVVMEHHRMNGYRASPFHHTSNSVTEPMVTSSDMRIKSGQVSSRDQKSKKQPWIDRQTREMKTRVGR